MIDRDLLICCLHYPKAVGSYYDQEGRGISTLGIVRRQIIHINNAWWDFLLTIVSIGKALLFFVCLFKLRFDSTLDGRGLTLIPRSCSILMLKIYHQILYVGVMFGMFCSDLL